MSFHFLIEEKTSEKYNKYVCSENILIEKWIQTLIHYFVLISVEKRK